MVLPHLYDTPWYWPVFAREPENPAAECPRESKEVPMKPIRMLASVVLCLSALPAGAQDAEEGQALFQSYCAACHGTEARGDGHMATILTVLPADLTQLSAGNGGVFPTARVVRQIDGRDPMLAHGGVMPLFGDFFEGDDAAMKLESGQPILTSRAIVDLVTWLEEVQE